MRKEGRHGVREMNREEIDYYSLMTYLQAWPQVLLTGAAHVGGLAVGLVMKLNAGGAKRLLIPVLVKAIGPLGKLLL